MNNIRIGTRASALALMQADKVRRAVENHNPGMTVEIVKIRTKGDAVTELPLHKIGAKGIFIKEIEEALLKGDIDIAVHSLKDMPCMSAPGLAIGAYLPRENPCDVLISEKYASLKELPGGAVIGTGSRRRESQLLAARLGLAVHPLRGNVETRIQKAYGGEMDAVIIAAAGVLRLGLADKIREYLPPDIFTPSPGQGIIAAQIRINDERAASVLQKANDVTAERCYAVEKEFLLETGGGCFLPVGALCEGTADGTALYGYIGDAKGEKVFKETVRFTGFDPLQGRELARKLLDAGGREVLLEIREKEIVITSTPDNFKALKAGIGRRGFEAVSFPTIEIKPVSFRLPGSDYDWIVFTSKNAVDIFIKKAGKCFFKSIKIAAIGAKTAALLEQNGLKTVFIPKRSGSKDFVREFSRRFSRIRKKFLLPASSKAAGTIASGLSKRGGRVSALVVYKTAKPRVSPEAAEEFINNAPYHFIFFSSPSAFNNFMAIKGLGKLSGAAHTAAIGPATASAMKISGVKPDITGKKASFRDVLEEVTRYRGVKK